jgi:hypothetical protein
VHLFLFAIGKTGHVFSFDERRALGRHLTKHAGRVAERSDQLAEIVK